MKKIILSLICALSFVACSSKQIIVLNDNEFASMARLIPNILHEQNILASDGSYIISYFDLLNRPKNVGNILFNSLNANFRFGDSKPRAFASSEILKDNININQYGFDFMQGVNLVQIELLAVAEYNNKQAWFVLCKIKSSTENLERDYYLVLEDFSKNIIDPTILAIYDCRYGVCKAYLNDPSPNNLEHSIVDVIPGQRQITAPPSKDQKSSSKIKEEVLKN